ncbi:UNVERIFIED_CONTAM: Adenylosuccinate synthetase, chloroplastic [Sesamum radiatum]|uniref:Adenylosuccinate synthetase, chloroplastic n=1 Tax=Sesamum radiatum TaxID=300843 RepID=A0AAW2L2X7_SESRA
MLKLVRVISSPVTVLICFCGANAGYTTENSAGKKYAPHLVPSGILSNETMCVIGNAIMVRLPQLFEELDELEACGVACKGRISVSASARLLFDRNQVVDGLRDAELAKLHPCYSSKVTQNGIKSG